MLQSKKTDVLNGPIFRSILYYAIPLLLVGLIQSMFNAVDIMVLRVMSGQDSAVASVGATSSIIHLLVNTFFGLSSGVRIVLARLLGAQEDEKASRTVSTALLAALGIGLLVSVVGLSCTEWFLQITQCPSDCYNGARVYMWIYLSAAPAIMIYNFGTSVINTTGDSRSPLYYMLISGGLNVFLNFIFCLVLEEKVAAVAIATALAQLTGAVLVIRHLLRLSGSCRLDLKRLAFDLPILGKLLRYGAPIALSHALYPLSNLQIQTQINSFGSAAVAGNTAMANIEVIVSTIASAPWATSTSVFVGQNLGAENRKRVKQSLFCTLGIVTALGVLLGGLATLFSRPLLHLYVSEESAVLYGQTRMMYTLLPMVVNGLNGVLAQFIQAFGYSIFSSLNSIVSVFLFRIFWMQLLYPMFYAKGLGSLANYDFTCRCFLVSWLLILSVNTAFSLYIYFGKFRKGKIRRTL